MGPVVAKEKRRRMDVMSVHLFFHCFTVHFHSIYIMVQHKFKCHKLKHLKSHQHVSIIR
jgi:hypothetical protein